MKIERPRRIELVDFPKIVCLCGSTRFMDTFREANLRETLAGNVILTVGCDTKSDEHLELSPETKEALDLLHKRKIALADEIFVLNVDGYIGESTKSEIAFAERAGKGIRYLEPTPERHGFITPSGKEEIEIERKQYD